jgi:NPCBM/NEW2 domain-containing protein
MKSSLISLAAVIIAVTALRADELRTLGGKSVSGTLVRVNEAEIVLKTDAGDVATPLSQVLALELKPVKGAESGVKLSALRLLDDTTLLCKSVVFKGKDVQATLPSGLSLKLPLSAVVSLLVDAGSKELQKRWPEIAGGKIKRDRIVVVSEGVPNVIEGSLGEADAQGKTIEFKLDGADKYQPVQLERVHGLVFWRPDPSPETPICKVIDLEGNSLYAVKLGVDGDTLNVQTTFGAKVPVKMDLLARLDFNLGKLTYLSDLEPAKVVEKSGIGLVVRYKKDANLDGEPIVLDKSYAKGLSMHAHTELEYNLAGKFKDLKGVLGVDTRIGADSQAMVTIYCDGEKRFAEEITPKAARPVALAIKDVQTLKIVVSSRNFLDLHDHVTFADARVSQ